MKKLVIVLCSTLVTALVLEGGMRAWLALRGEAYSSRSTREELLRLVDPSRDFVPAGAERAQAPAAQSDTIRQPVLHPFTGSEWEHDTGGVLAGFHEGFAPDEYTIVVVGGSVAASWATSHQAKLEEWFGDHPRMHGKRVRILNYAHAAYKQPQMVMRLAFLFSLGYRPDAVISLDGFNEVASALANHRIGAHPIYPSAPVWHALVRNLMVVDREHLSRLAELLSLRLEAERKARRALSLGLHRSSILGRLVLSDLRRISAERTAIQEGAPPEGRRAGEGGRGRPARADRQLNGPDYVREHAAVLATGARNWFESSLSIQAMCEARGVYYLHVLQPTLHDIGAKPMAPREQQLGPIPKGWFEGASEGYPLLRAHGAELKARGVNFHDASRIFEQVEEALYNDHCHLNQRGNTLLAESIRSAFHGGLP